MVAPNPLAARRRTNSSSFSVAVPSSWEESVVSGAITNRFAISRPLLNRKGDQTTIDPNLRLLRWFDSEIAQDPEHHITVSLENAIRCFEIGRGCQQKVV